MKADTKRRFTVFGAGLFVGCILSVFLFQYASMVEGPRETENLEVVLTTCPLAPGDVLEERCIERRVVAHQFTPPDVLTTDQLGLYVGRPITVALEPGSAVRTVDFRPEEE